MFTKILIANRGEIAVRIARACDELGVSYAVVVPQTDVGSPAAVGWGTAVAPIPGVGPRAYLDIDAVIAAAKAAGCDAVHPGYGFLSENAEFASACAREGLAFIGPSAAVLSTFGDKTAARALARRCDVPVPAGTSSATSLSQAGEFLASLAPGRAMMIKAIAGGGGRGMRVVRTADELGAAFERCQSEARSAFGRDDLYVEELVESARHIEIQILGDREGNVTHLGERECSVQRRHQKLIEIAPSPAVNDAQRAMLTGAAVRLARETGYLGLGTFEFLLDTVSGQAVFIEANPRLQVEHTVTEEVFGVDLVQSQIRLVAGETLRSLGLAQGDVPAPRGFAIQLRVNVETMQRDGSAAGGAGTIEVYRPASGPNVRVDGYVDAGMTWNPSFDSLLAKLIVRSTSGAYADLMPRAQRALREFVVLGVPTNLSFLRALTAHPDVVANAVTTRWLDVHAAALVDQAAGYASIKIASVVDGAPGGATSVAGGKALSAAKHIPVPGAIAVLAPMQGLLVSLEIAEGATVHAGQAVAIFEAMKMEHVVPSLQDGIVVRIDATKGQVLMPSEPIMWVLPADVAARVVDEVVDVDPAAIRPDLAEMLARQALTLDAARPHAVARRRKQGGRTARENVDDLCDAGSFIEYGGLGVAAQRSRRPLDDLQRTTPADGVITGIGTVNAERFGVDAAGCAVIAYDYSVLAGTQGFIGHAKQDRLLELTQQMQRPLVLFAEGGGGRPGDADEDDRLVAGLHLTTFKLFGQLSASVPLIGVVNGRCFAGNAALLGCCDVIIATRNSSIGMGGPAMIEGGGLGVVKADEVGPVSVQVPNGVIDILVDDEAQAVATSKAYLGFFQGKTADWQCVDQRELRRLIPENRLRVYDIQSVIQALADTGSVLELRAGYGLGIVTALARIEGRPVGLMANNSRHLGGAIDADASDKAARFIQLCDAHGLPIVSLCDTPGFMVGTAIEQEAMVRRCCRLFVTAANISVPMFAVVLRKGYGLGAMAMAGGSFHAPVFTVAWPTGEFGGMGLEGAVRLGFRDELAAIEDTTEREVEFNRRVQQLYTRGKALNAASLLEIDNVIDPADTRHWIVRGLDSVRQTKTGAGGALHNGMPKRRPHIDTW